MRKAEEIAKIIADDFSFWGPAKDSFYRERERCESRIAKAIHDARVEGIDLATDEVRNLLNWVHDLEQDASEAQLASLMNRIRSLYIIKLKTRKK